MDGRTPVVGVATRFDPGITRPVGVAVDGLAGWAVVLALGVLGALAVWRVVLLAREGVNVLAVDRERTMVEGLVDLGFVVAFLALLYVSVLWALGLRIRFLPGVALRGGSPWELQAVGVVVLLAAITLYAAALRAMGDSWRLTIDRDEAGELVTDGVFSRSRNPIYVGLALVAIGLAAVVGVVATTIAGAAVVAYFPYLIRREERFLAVAYGERYADYCARVHRYWTFRPGA